MLDKLNLQRLGEEVVFSTAQFSTRLQGAATNFLLQNCNNLAYSKEENEVQEPSLRNTGIRLKTLRQLSEIYSELKEDGQRTKGNQENDM